MSKESSLTAPKDRDINNKWRPSKDKPLTDEQTDEALKELNVDNFIEKYPRVERFYCDPSILDQKYSLVSFIPAKGASPDEDGIYGMIKTRGIAFPPPTGILQKTTDSATLAAGSRT